MISTLTAIIAIISLSTEKYSNAPIDHFINFKFLMGVLLLALFVLAFISHIILKRYYQVYISALLYATQVHYWAKMSGFWWFERVILDLRNRDISKNEFNKKDDYINKRTQSPKDSFFWYAVIIWIIGLVGLFGSSLIFLTKFLN